ncbi:MAG: NAD(P)-dependent oxidoreductase [Bacteroidota bacterium]
MIKILANDGLHPYGLTLLEEANYAVDTEKIAQDKLETVLPEYDVVIVRSATEIRKDLIDKCPRLKVIARAGVGVSNIDVAYAQSKNIVVMEAAAAAARSVAELTFAHIFTLARNLQQAHREMPTKGNSAFSDLKVSYSTGMQLRNKKLGIIGFGRVGQEVTRIGMALGMNVMPVDLKVEDVDIAINVYNSDQVRLSVNLRTEEFEKVLKESDFLTLHIPYTGGAPTIGAEEISRMKDGAFIINTAKGGVLDENALLEAIESGKLSGAGLDVYMNEPTPNGALLNHPNISVTPHIGASTSEARGQIALELADKLLAFFGDDK